MPTNSGGVGLQIASVSLPLPRSAPSAPLLYCPTVVYVSPVPVSRVALSDHRCPDAESSPGTHVPSTTLSVLYHSMGWRRGVGCLVLGLGPAAPYLHSCVPPYVAPCCCYTPFILYWQAKAWDTTKGSSERVVRWVQVDYDHDCPLASSDGFTSLR